MKKIDRRDKYNIKQGILKDTFNTFFNKNPTTDYTDNFKDKRKLMWNIYNPGQSFCDHLKRFHFIHFILKYKILVPILRFFSRILDRYLDKEVPKEIYNKELQIFNDAFENSLEDWKMYYIRNLNNDYRKKSLKYWKEESYTDEGGMRCLRTAKDIALTIALNDTAYREFIAILIHNITKLTLKRFKNDKNHIFYTDSNIHDISYYYIHKVKGTTVALLTEVEKQKAERK